MKTITRVTLSNTNNENTTCVYTYVTPATLGSILAQKGWVTEDFEAIKEFTKDRTIVTIEQIEIPLIEDGDQALDRLFFQ